MTSGFEGRGNARRSIITGINVLVASGFSLAGLVSPQSVLPGADTPGALPSVPTKGPFT
jgi:hypothetical protein